MTGNNEKLHLSAFTAANQDIFSAFVALTEAVFGMAPLPPWPGVAILDAAGRCLAGLQYDVLGFVGDGRDVPAAALRNVAVAPDRRGEGLMRQLMSPALAWCEARAALTMLFAETPELYARFGFVSVTQHAFEGPAPVPVGLPSARRLNLEVDGALLDRILHSRKPVSRRWGARDDAGLTAAKLREGDIGDVDIVESLDAVIVSELEDDTLVLVDILAAHIPSAAQILGTLGVRPRLLRTLFPPDLLGWEGMAVADDTGLMARGTLPSAMRRPFILPPTIAF